MVNSAIEVSISFSFYIYMSFPPLPTGISGDKINVVIYMTLIFHWGILKYSATDLIFEKAFTIFSAVFPAQSTNVWKSFLVACCPSAEGLSSALDKIFFQNFLLLFIQILILFNTFSGFLPFSIVSLFRAVIDFILFS